MTKNATLNSSVVIYARPCVVSVSVAECTWLASKSARDRSFVDMRARLHAVNSVHLVKRNARIGVYTHDVPGHARMDVRRVWSIVRGSVNTRSAHENVTRFAIENRVMSLVKKGLSVDMFVLDFVENRVHRIVEDVIEML